MLNRICMGIPITDSKRSLHAKALKKRESYFIVGIVSLETIPTLLVLYCPRDLLALSAVNFSVTLT